MKLPFNMGEITRQGFATNSTLLAYLFFAIPINIMLFSAIFLKAYMAEGITPIELIKMWLS